MTERRPTPWSTLLVLVVALLIAVTGAHVRPDAGADPSPGGAVTPAVVSVASTSGVVRSEVIGYSAQRRPIVAYELGDPRATYTALVLGSMHGYYERAGQTVTRAMRTMKIPVGMHLWVIDTINPDGDALQQRGNAHGVDLNRNWPYLWIPISRFGCTAFYCHYSGPRALSEPESVALTGFLKKIKPHRVVSIHQPLLGVDTTDGGARDPAFRNALAHNLNLPLKAFTCFGGCHGTLTGWLTRTTTAAAITVEFPQIVDASYLSGPAAQGILSALMVGVRVPARPVVSRISGVSGPAGGSGAAGPIAGGNTVTITGSGFTTAWKVSFGGVLGTRVKVVSAGKLTVVAPRHVAGLVNVQVTGVGGTSSMTTRSRYTYLAPPTVTSVTGTARAAGSTAGGNTVTIIGTGFTRITKVTFGDSTKGTGIRRLSANRLTVVAPKHSAGLVNLRVTGAGGSSTMTTRSRYTYVAPPTVTSVTGTAGATGATTAGNTVTIIGTGFTGITKVTFGSSTGTSVRRLSANRLTVVAPKHGVGLVNLRVTGTGGSSTMTTRSRYTYVAPPAITSVSGTAGATGATTGGNTVTISGTGFTGITKVTFGSTPGTSVRRLSANRLTVVAPKHVAGTVNVQLTGTYGRSVTVAAGRYTYADRTAPAPVADVTVTGTTTDSITLSWTNPPDADLAGVTIRRAPGPSPPSTPTSGILVAEASAGVTTFTDIRLDPETTYSYALFAHDAASNVAPPATVTTVTAAIADLDADRPGS